MLKLEKSIIGAFLFFVRNGASIDGITVAVDMFPDVVPVENWDSLGCVESFQPTTDKRIDDDNCPVPAGGYDVIETEVTLKDIMIFTTRETNPLFWEQVFGLPAAIVNDTPQTPFLNKERSILGWLKLQPRAGDGTDRAITNIWGQLSQSEDPTFSIDPTKPVWKFQVLASDIATFDPKNIV